MDDYKGVHIQFQGDRVRGLFHRPAGGVQAIAQQAVEAAIGLQSSVEGPLKACLPTTKGLHLAIGIDMGETVISRLGILRQRDAICLGQAVERAAELEEACDPDQIGVAQNIYHTLLDSLRRLFTYNMQDRCYVGTNLIYMHFWWREGVQDSAWRGK
jgi:class 3 adenylate cyclase